MSADLFRSILAKLAEIERRIAGTDIRGRVTDVDAEKAKARIMIGEDEDGKPVKSPWLPYTQKAGAMKIHSAPSVGEIMAARSSDGDLEQGVLEPFHWSEDNKAPSKNKDEHILKFGDVELTITASGVSATIGGVSFSFTGSGFSQDGGTLIHDNKNIGSDHKHTDVTPGGGLSGNPQ